MALGSDTSLRGTPVNKATMMPPATGSAPPAGRSQRYMGAPQADDNPLADFTNNRMAQAAGGAQAAIREMDKAGMSRGKGQRYAADIAEAAADADARGDVAQAEMGMAQQNAAARQAYGNMRKNENLNTEGLLEQLRSNRRTEQLAQQGWRQDLYETMRRGQFGLDQMRMDMSPLYRRLLS